jgi:hypothetical protein
MCTWRIGQFAGVGVERVWWRWRIKIQPAGIAAAHRAACPATNDTPTYHAAADSGAGH